MRNNRKQDRFPEKLHSITDTAEILGRSLKTIRRRIAAGDLAVIRDGRLVRVHPDDLHRYINRRRFG